MTNSQRKFISWVLDVLRRDFRSNYNFVYNVWDSNDQSIQSSNTLFWLDCIEASVSPHSVDKGSLPTTRLFLNAILHKKIQVKYYSPSSPNGIEVYNHPLCTHNFKLPM